MLFCKRIESIREVIAHLIQQETNGSLCSKAFFALESDN